jgi:hypothetical protein
MNSPLRNLLTERRPNAPTRDHNARLIGEVYHSEQVSEVQGEVGIGIVTHGSRWHSSHLL